MGFRLTPRLMTLDDLELLKFEFSVNFSGFRRFRTQQQLNAWRWASIVSENVVSTSDWSNFWQAFASRGFVSDSWAFLYHISMVSLMRQACVRLSSVCMECIVAKWCVLLQKLLLTAFRNSYEKSISTKMNDLDVV